MIVCQFLFFFFTVKAFYDYDEFANYIFSDKGFNMYCVYNFFYVLSRFLLCVVYTWTYFSIQIVIRWFCTNTNNLIFFNSSCFLKTNMVNYAKMFFRRIAKDFRQRELLPVKMLFFIQMSSK